jgi:hypothetical protein
MPTSPITSSAWPGSTGACARLTPKIRSSTLPGSITAGDYTASTRLLAPQHHRPATTLKLSRFSRCPAAQMAHSRWFWRSGLSAAPAPKSVIHTNVSRIVIGGSPFTCSGSAPWRGVRTPILGQSQG